MYEIAKDFAGPLVTLIQTIVIGVGAYLAWATIKSNSEIAKKRATLDLITQVLQGEEYKSRLLIVNAMKKAGEQPGSLFTQLQSANGDQREQLKTKLHAAQFVLNKFSIMAIGIRNNALDEQSFKEYYYSTFVEISGFLQTFMMSVRAIASKEIENRDYVSNQTVYEEIIWLLERWRQSPLKSRPPNI